MDPELSGSSRQSVDYVALSVDVACALQAQHASCLPSMLQSGTQVDRGWQRLHSKAARSSGLLLYLCASVGASSKDCTLTGSVPFAAVSCSLPCLASPVAAPQVEEYADEVFDLLDNGAHMYFCGLKGMMPGILDMLQRVSKEKGRNFDEFVEGLKHKNQWHVSIDMRAAGGLLCCCAGQGYAAGCMSCAEATSGCTCLVIANEQNAGGSQPCCMLRQPHGSSLCNAEQHIACRNGYADISLGCCFVVCRLRCTKRVLAQSCCAVRLYITQMLRCESV